MKCESCGMTMTKAEEFGGHDPNNKHCVYCSDADGNLKPRNEVREGMIQFWMARENIDRKTAEEKTDSYMSSQPAWRT
ncbi:MAG: zinc ribbon domain-containing protein [Promethearchaeota archaeon]